MTRTDGSPGRVTIREVAEHAGVSTSTVSNVLNDYPHVRPGTRSAVLQAVRATGYHRTFAGRVLRTGSSRLVAVAVPDLRIGYYAELVHALGVEAARRDYSLLITETNADPAAELAAAGGYRGADADAVLLFAFGITSEAVHAAARPDIPVIIFGRDVAAAWTDHFLLDLVDSAAALVDHLVAGGRTRIAYLGWLLDQPTAVARRQAEGVAAALGRHGLALEPDRVVDLPAGDAAAGEAAVDLLHRDPAPDAVITASARLAVGFARAARRAGVAVPEQVAVASWGGSVLCTDVDPQITAVWHRHDRNAVAVWDLLERRLADGPAEVGEARAFQWELVVRASTRPAT